MRLFLVSLLGILLHFEAGEQVIRIESQEQFDMIMDKIKTALANHPQELTVSFKPGTFYYDEGLIKLDGLSYPEVALRFVGNGATLTAKGEDYVNGDMLRSRLDTRSGINSGDSDVMPWSKVFYSEGKVKVVDPDKHLYKLRCSDIRRSSLADINASHILITEWYKSEVMKVHEIENRSVIFKANNGRNDLDLDYDYARTYPRFKLFNAEEAPIKIAGGRVVLQPGLTTVHISQECRLLTAYHTAFKSISFEGFRFVGNRDKDLAMMDFTNTQTEGITVSDCEFCGLRSKLIQVAYSPDFLFANNYIHDCYKDGIESFSSPRTDIRDNTFHNMGLGYGGIAVGMHYKQERDCKITGTVDHNELWYSDDYQNDYQEHTLMDSGAIYVFTQNDRTVIRDNFIHDYTGMKDNRGIFLDDGASHVLVFNNTILRIRNSWSIDSRLVNRVVSEPGSQVREANIGNLIYKNQVDGEIRFEKNR